MGPVNWLAVVLSPLLMLGLWLAWQRLAGQGLAGQGPQVRRLSATAGALVLLALPAVMIGHALARIGADKLAVKPWLYWMQTGGVAVFFVIPALWLGRVRSGWVWREALGEAGFWLVAFLAMGTVFRVLG